MDNIIWIIIASAVMIALAGIVLFLGNDSGMIVMESFGNITSQNWVN